MKAHEWIIRYYPDTEITCYPWVYHDRYEHYLPKSSPRDKIGHMRTGPYDCGKFAALKESIAKDGILNPFIIEYYDKHLPNAEGTQGFESLAIRTGNNRAEAMHQLGLCRGPALFVIPRRIEDELPKDPYRAIRIDRHLESEVAKLWGCVEVFDNDHARPYRDSELLCDLITLGKAVRR